MEEITGTSNPAVQVPEAAARGVTTPPRSMAGHVIVTWW